MSRIFDGNNEKDCQDLMALLTINPRLPLEMSSKKDPELWQRRFHNYDYNGHGKVYESKIRGPAKGLLYRIKEDQS